MICDSRCCIAVCEHFAIILSPADSAAAGAAAAAARWLRTVLCCVVCACVLLLLQDVGAVAIGFRLFPKLMDLNGMFTVFSHFADRMPDFKQQLAAYRSSRS